MNCNVEITAVGTADGLEVSIHGGSVGMMTAAELIVARVLMAVADDEENLAGLKDSMFEIINEMVKDCWAEKTAKSLQALSVNSCLPWPVLRTGKCSSQAASGI